MLFNCKTLNKSLTSQNRRTSQPSGDLCDKYSWNSASTVVAHESILNSGCLTLKCAEVDPALTSGVGKKISRAGDSDIDESDVRARYSCICMRWLRRYAVY